MKKTKDKHIILRIDEETKELAKQKAKQNNLTLSKYIIKLILNN